MKKVYICAPLKGDIVANTERAKLYSDYAKHQGVLPIAPHCVLKLDDTVPELRQLALHLGKEILKQCDEVWCCGEIISAGMHSELELAKEHGIPIKQISSQVLKQAKGNTDEIEPIYQIYQLKCNRYTRPYRFLAYAHLLSLGYTVNQEDYELVYTAPLGASTLEDIYRKFNVDRPEDFQGHSLSVSDVVVVTDKQGERAYYVDSFGFKKLPQFGGHYTFVNAPTASRSR